MNRDALRTIEAAAARRMRALTSAYDLAARYIAKGADPGYVIELGALVDGLEGEPVWGELVREFGEDGAATELARAIVHAMDAVQRRAPLVV